jgi:hypothetical protein
MHGLRLSVLGLIASAALLLIKPMGRPSVSFIDWRSWVIFAVVCFFTILPMLFKEQVFLVLQKKSAIFLKTALNLFSHPIVLIILSGLVGYFVYR